MKKILEIILLSFTLACSQSESFSVDKKDCLCAKTCYCIEEISQDKAELKLSEGAVLIDVRTPAEFNSAHIEGAINIPVEKIDTISLNKDQVIILYCRSGNRSRQAANTLLAMGYKYVFDFGAFDGWK